MNAIKNPKVDTRHNIRRRYMARIRRMTQDEARAVLDALAKRGHGIGAAEIRDLTGGYSCQSLDFEVRRALGARAGYCS